MQAKITERAAEKVVRRLRGMKDPAIVEFRSHLEGLLDVRKHTETLTIDELSAVLAALSISLPHLVEYPIADAGVRAALPKLWRRWSRMTGKEIPPEHK